MMRARGPGPSPEWGDDDQNDKGERPAARRSAWAATLGGGLAASAAVAMASAGVVALIVVYAIQGGRSTAATNHMLSALNASLVAQQTALSRQVVALEAAISRVDTEGKRMTSSLAEQAREFAQAAAASAAAQGGEAPKCPDCPNVVGMLLHDACKIGARSSDAPDPLWCLTAQIPSLGGLMGRVVYHEGLSAFMMAPTNDEYVGAFLLRNAKPPEPATLTNFLQLIRPGDTVVDAGANLGSYSVFFAKKAGPTGQVYSFEPQMRIFQLLSINAINNRLFNIKPHHMALSFREGVTHMDATVPDGTSKGQDLTKLDGDAKINLQAVNYGGMRIGAGGEEVRMATLDSLALPNVSFIKVDVQGAEKLFFWGARETIRKHLPVIAYEVDGPFGLTEAMVTSLGVPPEVQEFDIGAFLDDLGFGHSKHSTSHDPIRLPPGFVE